MEPLSANPFAGTFIVKVARRYYDLNDAQRLMREDANEKDYYQYEVNEKTALYEDKDFISMLLSIAKPNTLRLYLFIVYKALRRDRDWIELQADKVQEYLGISRATLYMAIDQLREFRLLAPKKGRNVYWVNAQFIFNGSRVTYISEVAPNSILVVDRKMADKLKVPIG